MNQIEQVTTWIDAAGQKPSVRNLVNYLAYTMSELAECLEAADSEELYEFSQDMQGLSESLRSGVFDEHFEEGRCNKEDLLDGAIDTAWCSIGLAHMLGDAEGAFNEVAESNHSKFENGVCALDETGKVIKGPSYFKPELAKFLREAGHE